jgi:hypothetical protein
MDADAPRPVEPARPEGPEVATPTTGIDPWALQIAQDLASNSVWLATGFTVRAAWRRLRRDRTPGTPTASEARTAALARVCLASSGITRTGLQVDSTTIPREGPAVVVVRYVDPDTGRTSLRATVEVLRRGGRVEARIETLQHH